MPAAGINVARGGDDGERGRGLEAAAPATIVQDAALRSRATISCIRRRNFRLGILASAIASGIALI